MEGLNGYSLVGNFDITMYQVSRPQIYSENNNNILGYIF